MAQLFFCSVVASLFFVLSAARSDEFGRNPQHEFGSVTGRHVNPVLPFWTMQGDAFANEDFVRLTPDRQSKTGAVWNSQRLVWKNWEILIKFNVNGVGSVGADGWAFWLAREVNVMGKFFGFQEKFNGIGIVVDTYDNDGSGQHPLVTLLQNDGRKTYEHHHEGGEHHASDMELGHCSTRMRNLKSNSLMKITYENNLLTVEIKLEDQPEWTPCIRATAVIDTGLYMGLTAATGHLADNHDIHGVSVRNLDEDAKFFDSESRFAQFSKYTIAEALGRIQADIRGASQKGAPQPIASSAGSASSSSGGVVTAKIDDSLRSELASLRREIGQVINSIQEGQANAASRSSSNSYQSGATNVQELVAPIQRTSQELRQIQESLKREVGDLNGETKKLSLIQGKLDRLISNLETEERQSSKRNQQNVRETNYESSNSGGGIFTFWNLLFFVVCVVAAYLGFTLYRLKSKSSNTMKLV